MYSKPNALSPKEIEKLSKLYQKHNFIDARIAEQYHVKRGLRNSDGTGVLAGLTNICDVVGYENNGNEIIPTKGKLYYRGYDVEKILNRKENQNRLLFEEMCWLILFGFLPSQKQIDSFTKLLFKHRELPEGFAETMIFSAPSKNIMNKMARSVLAMYAYDENPDDTSLNNLIRQSMILIAQLPTMMIYAYQAKTHTFDHKSLFFHYPTPDLSTAEHILSISRPDQTYTKEEAKLLDTCLVLHMDHGGGNNSTFTTRVLSSTGTDTYSTIAASLGSLKGPKHGGANHKVMRQLDLMLKKVKNINDDQEISDYLRSLLKGNSLDQTNLIYGIGHAVYTLSDPRAQALKKLLKKYAIKHGFEKEFIALDAIERLAPSILQEKTHSNKPLCANIDLYSGLVYRVLGIDEELFTPLFSVSRIAGWCGHRIEEIEFANRVIRPAYQCLSPIKEYISINKR